MSYIDEKHVVATKSALRAGVDMRVAVLIPSYRRPDDLRRCLAALAAQRRMPDEVLVIVRDTDAETWDALKSIEEETLPLKTLSVTEPGVVYAMNAGLAKIDTDIVAITDDDAVPHADWLERILTHYEARRDLGGVGGRDRMHIDGVLQVGRKRIVGRVPLLGKHTGNHHLGFGDPRHVDMLKGVNGSYRLEAIRPIGFDTRLRGSGAQVHWEISLGLALKRAGWKLLYDPQILVDHYTAERFDEDQRTTFNSLAMKNAAYNDALIRLEQLSLLGKALYLSWALAIGTRAAPGLVQWIRFVRTKGFFARQKFKATVQGRLEAWRDATHEPKRRAP